MMLKRSVDKISGLGEKFFKKKLTKQSASTTLLLEKGVNDMSDRKQILTIEDDAGLRMLLDYLLRNSYKVRTQKDGIEGMLWLENGNMPDLILVDTEMPRLNGFDFLKNIRKSGYYRNVPVVMMVGADQSENIINYLHQGATDILMKPFNPKDLFDKIDHILQNKN